MITVKIQFPPQPVLKKKTFEVVLTDMTNNCNHRNKFSKTIIYLSQFTEKEKTAAQAAELWS